MTSVDEMSKLKALRRARERLETALATDESWQALLRSSATAGAGGGDSARLEAELRSNPLYRAWTNVNAAIEARQRSAPIETCGATAAPPSSAVGLDPVPRQGDDGRVGAEAREPAPRPPRCAEEEASVSFVAFAPAATAEDRPQRAATWRAPTDLPPRQGREATASAATPGAEDRQGEEAQVSLISVEARRHAGAVDRLLRALRGEPNAG